MTRFRSRTTFTAARSSRVAWAATIGLVLVIGCASNSSVRAADDDEPELLDTQIVRHILKGLGLRRGDDASIEYRERSPLVLPNGKQLPRPETASAAKAAGWPDDPDVKQAKQRKEAKKRQSYTEGVDDKPLLPSQYSSRAPGSPDSKPNGLSPTIDDNTSKPMSQAELGSKSMFSWTNLWGSKEEYATFTGEPARSNLTEPPAGYRTPSPNQPFGVGKEKWKPTVIDKNEPVK